MATLQPNPAHGDTHRSRKSSRKHKDVPDVPVAFVVSSWLTETAERVRSRPIPWEGYVRAGLITDNQLNTLRAGTDPQVACVLLELLSSLARVDTLQAVLVRLEDLLEKDRSLAGSLHALHSRDPSFPYAPLMSSLDKDDITVAILSAKILTFLLGTAEESGMGDPAKDPMQRPAVVQLMSFFAKRLLTTSSTTPSVTSGSSGNVDPTCEISVQLLASALQVAGARKVYYDSQGGVPALMELIRRAQGNPQLLYECCLCLWELTYDTLVASHIDRAYDIIPVLIETAKSALKEKVIRVCVATLRNLVEKAIDANVGSMLVHKLLPFCESLSTRKWSDEDIAGDLEVIMTALNESFQKLNTFDAYVTEVESKKLDWTPSHQSDEFWREHAARLDERDYALVKMLAGLVKSDHVNAMVLAVACNDLGQYVKFHPTGKKMVDKLGAKERMLQLMTHEDAEVRYQALLAVQKYMVHAWD